MSFDDDGCISERGLVGGARRKKGKEGKGGKEGKWRKERKARKEKESVTFSLFSHFLSFCLCLFIEITIFAVDKKFQTFRRFATVFLTESFEVATQLPFFFIETMDHEESSGRASESSTGAGASPERDASSRRAEADSIDEEMSTGGPTRDVEESVEEIVQEAMAARPAAAISTNSVVTQVRAANPSHCGLSCLISRGVPYRTIMQVIISVFTVPT